MRIITVFLALAFLFATAPALATGIDPAFDGVFEDGTGALLMPPKEVIATQEPGTAGEAADIAPAAGETETDEGADIDAELEMDAELKELLKF